MFWKYVRFETKLLFRNPKNFLIGLFLLLFFPLYFLYFIQSDPISIKEQKQEERIMTDSMFNSFPDNLRETPEGTVIYDLIAESSTLVNMQRYYIWLGNPGEDYIRDGLRLNEVRLKLHELGNQGIPEHLIIPVNEILKEDARLRFIQDNHLPIETNIYVSTNYLVNALNTMGGLLFFIIVLVSGSELLLFEQRHRTVLFGFPISFRKKVAGKLLVHFIHIFTFLIVGVLAGFLYATKQQGMGHFSSPIVIYQDGDYITVSTLIYVLYMFLSFAITAMLVLFISVLFNQLFKNAYVNILLGMGIYLLANLLIQIGHSFFLIEIIAGIDSKAVLSGHLATITGNGQLDYWFSIILLLVLSVVILGLIAFKNKSKYFTSSKSIVKEGQTHPL